MNGNGVLGIAKSYQGTVASIVVTVGSGVLYLSRSLATREEINETKQEMKKEITEVKTELKSDISENRKTLEKIYDLLIK